MVEVTVNKGENKIYLLHRLDSATSGVILVCTSKDISIRIKNLFRERLVLYYNFKTYLDQFINTICVMLTCFYYTYNR